MFYSFSYETVGPIWICDPVLSVFPLILKQFFETDFSHTEGTPSQENFTPIFGHLSPSPGYREARHPSRQSHWILNRTDFVQLKVNACKPFNFLFVFPFIILLAFYPTIVYDSTVSIFRYPGVTSISTNLISPDTWPLS